MIRLGLCCKFKDEPIRFRTTTATYLLRISRDEACAKLSALCLANTQALRQAIEYCAAHGIGSFRINSQILPVKTHPQAGYDIANLPDGDAICAGFLAAGERAREQGVRLTFHPDQFVLLNSPRPEVTERAIADLAYQAAVADWVGADVVNIHGGGVYGDKPSALARLVATIQALPAAIRALLTLENDDRSYTPTDLLPVCRQTGIPLVYDAHHHRCLPDGLSTAEATVAALTTWDREPLCHISSPKHGWDGPDPRPHHEFIDCADIPAGWRDLDLTVEVEAKAKEAAIAGLRATLLRDRWKLWEAK
jgi:UV DNA damage endonuclease